MGYQETSKEEYSQLTNPEKYQDCLESEEAIISQVQKHIAKGELFNAGYFLMLTTQKYKAYNPDIQFRLAEIMQKIQETNYQAPLPIKIKQEQKEEIEEFYEIAKTKEYQIILYKEAFNESCLKSYLKLLEIATKDDNQELKAFLEKSLKDTQKLLHLTTAAFSHKNYDDAIYWNIRSLTNSPENDIAIFHKREIIKNKKEFGDKTIMSLIEKLTKSQDPKDTDLAIDFLSKKIEKSLKEAKEPSKEPLPNDLSKFSNHFMYM